jgi:uncharacterized integral membrane protein
MKLFFYLLLFIVITVFGLTFSLKNPQLIQINYYPDLVFSAPLVVVLLLTLLLGVLIGLLAMSLSIWRRHRELAQARKEIKKLGEQLQSLRSSATKGAT